MDQLNNALCIYLKVDKSGDKITLKLENEEGGLIVDLTIEEIQILQKELGAALTVAALNKLESLLKQETMH